MTTAISKIAMGIFILCAIIFFFFDQSINSYPLFTTIRDTIPPNLVLIFFTLFAAVMVLPGKRNRFPAIFIMSIFLGFYIFSYNGVNKIEIFMRDFLINNMVLVLIGLIIFLLFASSWDKLKKYFPSF